jgi:hypothetical protein
MYYITLTFAFLLMAVFNRLNETKVDDIKWLILYAMLAMIAYEISKLSKGGKNNDE